jgi:pimeloyl-ACP methyl ester carboxylesterase
MQTRTISTDYDDVTIREWGEGGRLLLALHSMGPVSTGALYNCAVGPLVEAGYHVVAPDLPGYGLTAALPPDEYDVARLADRMWALSDALGGTRVTLVGHSWGGAIAMRMQMEAGPQVEALVLVDSGHIDYADAPGADLASSMDELIEQTEAGRLRAPDRAGVASDLELPIDDPVVDAFMEGLVDDGSGGLITRTLGVARGPAMYHLARARVTAQWPAIAAARIPTLLLLATEPAATRETNEAAASRFRAAIPHADVRFVEGASHSLITDERERFGQMVRDWLATLA